MYLRNLKNACFFAGIFFEKSLHNPAHQCTIFLMLLPPTRARSGAGLSLLHNCIKTRYFRVRAWRGNPRALRGIRGVCWFICCCILITSLLRCLDLGQSRHHSPVAVLRMAFKRFYADMKKPGNLTAVRSCVW